MARSGLKIIPEEQFGLEKLASDLQDKSIDYFFVWYKKQPIGFLKVNYEAAFADFNKKTTSELEKMYIFPQYKDKGIGKIALESVINTILRKKKKILFLDVLDTNEKAILFYEKSGFKFHSKARLKYVYFKDELKGLNRMYMELT